MKWRKVMAGALATTMVISTLAACGSGDNGKETTAAGGSKGTENSTQGTDDTTANGDKLSGSLTVTTWDNETSPQFRVVIEAFKKKYPDVEIKVNDTSADEYNNSLGVSLSAAQSDPDIIWVKDMGSLLQMADKKQLLSIDDFIKKDGFDTSVYKGAFEQLQYNGTSYALPYRSDWYVLYYNKDLFDAQGVEYPSNDMTWDEYYDLAAKMTSGEGSNKVFGTHNHTWQALVTNWAVQDGEHTVVEKDYSFLSDWYKDALELQKNGYIQDYTTLKTANLHYSSVFKNQQTAMMPMGTWFIATLMQAQADGEIDFNWGVATIPHPDNTEAGYTVGAITPVAISAYTDEPELSWEFLKFASSEEAANILAKEGVFTNIQTDETLKTITTAEFFPQEEGNVEALKYTNFVFDRPIDPKIEEIKKVLEEEHDLIMIGERDVDEGIAEIQRRVAEIKGW